MNIGRAKTVNLGARTRVSLDTLVPKGVEVRSINTGALVSNIKMIDAADILPANTTSFMPLDQGVLDDITSRLTAQYINAANITPSFFREPKALSHTNIAGNILSYLPNVPSPFIIAAQTTLGMNVPLFQTASDAAKKVEKKSSGNKMEMSGTDHSAHERKIIIKRLLKQKIEVLRERVDSIRSTEWGNLKAIVAATLLNQHEERLESSDANLEEIAAELAALEIEVEVLAVGISTVNLDVTSELSDANRLKIVVDEVVRNRFHYIGPLLWPFEENRRVFFFGRLLATQPDEVLEIGDDKRITAGDLLKGYVKSELGKKRGFQGDEALLDTEGGRWLVAGAMIEDLLGSSGGIPNREALRILSDFDQLMAAVRNMAREQYGWSEDLGEVEDFRKLIPMLNRFDLDNNFLSVQGARANSHFLVLAYQLHKKGVKLTGDHSDFPALINEERDRKTPREMVAEALGIELHEDVIQPLMDALRREEYESDKAKEREEKEAILSSLERIEEALRYVAVTMHGWRGPGSMYRKEYNKMLTGRHVYSRHLVVDQTGTARMIRDDLVCAYARHRYLKEHPEVSDIMPWKAVKAYGNMAKVRDMIRRDVLGLRVRRKKRKVKIKRTRKMISEVKRTLADPAKFRDALANAVMNAAPDYDPFALHNIKPKFLETITKFRNEKFDIGNGLIARGMELFEAAAGHFAKEDELDLTPHQALKHYGNHVLFDRLCRQIYRLISKRRSRKK